MCYSLAFVFLDLLILFSFFVFSLWGEGEGGRRGAGFSYKRQIESCGGDTPLARAAPKKITFRVHPMRENNATI